MKRNVLILKKKKKKNRPNEASTCLRGTSLALPSPCTTLGLFHVWKKSRFNNARESHTNSHWSKTVHLDPLRFTRVFADYDQTVRTSCRRYTAKPHWTTLLRSVSTLDFFVRTPYSNPKKTPQRIPTRT